MALHLITGYAGEEHITSADQGAYNLGTFGEGQFVLNRGSKFAATIISNNKITIADGELLMQGRFIKLPAGTTEDINIDNGTSGMLRKDLICVRYEKDSGTSVETATFVVKKGTESASSPSDPSYTQGDITDGDDLVNEMPLYRVELNGINISAVTSLFSVKMPMVEYMDSYQLQPATASTLGGVKVGGASTSGLSIDAAGNLTAPSASTSQKGVVQIPDSNSSFSMSGGKLYLNKASSSVVGGVSIPSNAGVYMSGNNLYLSTASKTQKGGIKIQDTTYPSFSVSSDALLLNTGSANTKGGFKLPSSNSSFYTSSDALYLNSATASVKGGVTIQSTSGLQMNGSDLSVKITSGLGLAKDSDGIYITGEHGTNRFTTNLYARKSVSGGVSITKELKISYTGTYNSSWFRHNRVYGIQIYQGNTIQYEGVVFGQQIWSTEVDLYVFGRYTDDSAGYLETSYTVYLYY